MECFGASRLDGPEVCCIHSSQSVEERELFAIKLGVSRPISPLVMRIVPESFDML